MVWWRRVKNQSSACNQALASDANGDDDNGPPTVLSHLQFENSGLATNSMPTLATMPVHLISTPEGQSIANAAQYLYEGLVVKAWQELKGWQPQATHQKPYLETLERIALALENMRLQVQALEALEHMADIDPSWRNVKSQLMRARKLLQNHKVNQWGTVPPQPEYTGSTQQLGKYLIEQKIGRGAMGTVYAGYDPATGRRLAIKTMALDKEFSGADLIDARDRFLREAEIAVRLDHPDIVRVMDAGEVQGVAFIAMELVNGHELSNYIAVDKQLPWPDLVRIMVRVAQALHYGHSRGVTHRDIKPANIMFDTQKNMVKLMDFGVARVADAARTRTGVVLGTPCFMSPEQLGGQTIDGRSDIYSLGVTMFQLLTGRLPYAHHSMSSLIHAVANDPAPHVCDIRPDLPISLGDVVALALQKHPKTRYANGQQMADDLRQILSLTQA